MTHQVMGLDGFYPLLFVIWLAPLAGAIVCWAFGPQLGRRAAWVGTTALGVALVSTLLSWQSGTQGSATALGAHQALASWLPGFDFGLLLDPLSLIWALIITGVGFLIHLYSIGYMDGDRAIARFFAYMNFFVFAMLTLVLSDNFVGLLVGWGLVGLASYFLIGFWFYKPSAVAAARKAFVINVVGDVGIMFAIFIMFAHIGSIGFGDTFANVPALGGSLFLVCLCLFVGAAAKSAQFPLQTWLADAMEGPTPVSALIHAATMVTAGVYLVARCWPLWNASPHAQLLVGTVGGVTALLGAILGIAQWDIKRILAYSTMSQIGYMIMGVGVGAYEAGVAHFFTHAFFKALLFLGAGLIIHELADEQDIRRMGGLMKKMPFAFWCMLAGVLAICGIPLFSGYFSKDAVIYGALEHGHPWLYVAGILTAGITAFYMFRLFFVTFLGTYRGEPVILSGGEPVILSRGEPVILSRVEGRQAHTQAHAPAWLMQLPVGILALFAVIAGYVLVGSHSLWSRFFAQTFRTELLPTPPISETMTTIIVLVVVLAGIGLAYVRYATAPALAHAAPRLERESARMPALLSNAYYFDALIEWVTVRPAQLLGVIFGSWLDPHVIDGAVRDTALTSRWLGTLMRSFQTGLLRAYAIVIVLGAAGFIAYYVLAGGAH